MTEADQSSTPVTPLDASTVLLIRDSDDGIEVFMVVRHSKADFAGGALVFPGGKVDPEDADPKLEESHGINVTLPTRLMALRGAANASLALDNVRVAVPDTVAVGEAGQVAGVVGAHRTAVVAGVRRSRCYAAPWPSHHHLLTYIARPGSSPGSSGFHTYLRSPCQSAVSEMKRKHVVLCTMASF